MEQQPSMSKDPSVDYPLDLDFVREQFPSARWQWAFFENAGGVFVPHTVIDRITTYMTKAQVQPGYPFPASMDALTQMNSGHDLMAKLVGAETDEITIAASTSINIYVLAQSLRGLWQPGDEIIVSTLNHEANSGPWRRLAEFGIKIVEWPVNIETAALEVNDLDQLLSDKTRLVAFPHVSNITGDINDVRMITEKVHRAGALVCVDGVAYAPHRAMKLKDWDVDFYVFSFYKIFGPHLGCLYGKREHLLKAKGQSHYFFSEDDLTHKFNPAGPNHESIAALAGIADYFENLCKHHFANPAESFFQRTQDLYGRIATHEESLAAQLLDFINSKSEIRLIGTSSSDQAMRVPTFSFTVKDMQSSALPSLLAQDKVAIGSGHFYAKRLLDSLQLEDSEDGVVRCSMAHYNTPEEVDQLIQALDKNIV